MNTKLGSFEALLTEQQSELNELAQLRRIKQRYHSLVKVLDKKVWIIEGDGRDANLQNIVSCWRDVIGDDSYNKNPRSWIEQIHPEDQPAALEAWKRSVESGNDYHSVYRLRNRDGIWRRVSAKGVPIRESNGNICEWVGTFEDIADPFISDSDQRQQQEDADKESTLVTSESERQRLVYESERRYRAMVSATSDVVYRMNADWSTMNALDGRDFIASNSNPINNWMAKNIPELEHARLSDAICAAIATKTTFQLEHQVCRVDGTIGWTFSRAIPILDEQGNILEWFGTASDVTRRKVAEEELRDIRSRMEAALNAGAIGTWSWDVVADQFFGDSSFAKLFAVDPSLVKGGGLKSIMNSIHPDDLQRIGDRIQHTLLHENHYEENYRIAQLDGSWKWVAARGQVERDESGRALRFPGVVIDITDWKKAEESLQSVTKESEERRRLYETILSSTPDFIYVFSLDHRILYANQALLSMWGYTSEETIGKTFLDVGYEVWHAEMHCREIDEVQRTKAPLRGEVPFDGTNGRRIYDYIFVPVTGVDGDVVAVAGTTRDVTERRQLEDAMRETDRRKDEFLAMLAHELRNPLVPIRTGLDILALESEKHQNIIKLMNDQMVHIIRLVDDLLDVSRIMQSKVELRIEQVEVADICKRSVETVRSVIASHKHELSVSLPDESIWLNADPVRLVQVIGNLLNNSAKYMHSGGKIELKVERQKEHVVITVKDTGIGIEPELLPRVFDLFTQSSRSLDRAQGGLGIGLTLVQRLVNMHDGTVTAQSDGVGHGSTFVITLPIVEKVYSTDRPSFEIESHSSRKIVVVDDNRSASFLIGKLLEKLGDHQVQVAHDGESALAKIQETDPEIIFLDIGLPGMDGYEVCRAIRALSEREDLLIVALTGYGQEEHRSRSKEVGFDEHLVKPPSIQQISKILFHPKLRSK